MRSSLIGLSAARQTPARRNRIASTAQILEFIVSGHCTPVQGIEKGRLFAPSRLYANVQVEIDLHPQDALHLLARQSADFLEHGAPSADHDGLLAIALHPDRGKDPRE